MKQIESVFKPIPMAIFIGYTKIGTIYPKDWIYNDIKLTEDLAVPTKEKYRKKLEKVMADRR